MIKKYNQFINESLLDKLEGPTEEEMWENIKVLPLIQILDISIKNDFVKGLKYALERNVEFGISIFNAMISFKSHECIHYIKSLGKLKTFKKPSKELLGFNTGAFNYHIEYNYDDILDVLQILSNNDINIEFTDKALRSAVKNGNYELVKYMLEHDANPSANNFQAVRWGETYKQDDIVKLLNSYIKSNKGIEVQPQKRFVVDNNKFKLFLDDVLVSESGFNIEQSDKYIKEKYVSLYNIKTHISFKRKGFAKYLLEQIFNYVKNELNINIITLIVYKNNHKAINLYLDCGFEIYEDYSKSYSLIKKL